MLILWGVQISLIFPLQSYTSRSETPDGVQLIEPSFCHVRCQGASETVVGGGRTDAGLREETHPLLSSSWRPAEHQVPQMTAFGNQSPYLGVCVVSNVVEAIPYCSSALPPLTFLSQQCKNGYEKLQVSSPEFLCLFITSA